MTGASISVWVLAFSVEAEEMGGEVVRLEFFAMHSMGCPIRSGASQSVMIPFDTHVV